MGGVDPRQVNSMMKRLGIDVQEIEGVQEVVVRTAGRDYVFRKASVSVMRAQGTETWQVSGEPEVVEKGAAGAAPAQAEDKGGGAAGAAGEDAGGPSFTEVDVDLVVAQTGCSEERARDALAATRGDIAEAILRIKPD